MTKRSARPSDQSQRVTVSDAQTAQSQPKDVEAEPFSKRRTKSEFIRWVEEWSQQKVTLDGIASLLNRNRDDKRTYEEALPVYHYVLRFYKDRADILVELSGDSRKGDGRILSSDGSLIEHVEVTMPFAPTDHLERRHLGAGLTLPDFWRSVETYNMDESARLLDEAIAKKLAKKYPAQTVLLVMLPPGMVTEDDESRFEQIAKKLSPIPSTSQFHQIYVMEIGGAFWRELLIDNGTSASPQSQSASST